MRRTAGFTLVEMMIAIAIIAILMGVGMPSFQTFIENTKIRTAAENMLAGLHLARTEALRRNTNVTLWMVNNISASCALSSTGSSWVVSLDPPTGACLAASSETVAPRLIQSRSGSDASDGVNVAATGSIGNATNCITFNGFGRVADDCTSWGKPIRRISFVSANSPSKTRDLQVRISPGGAIRLCDPDVSTNTDPAFCGDS